MTKDEFERLVSADIRRMMGTGALTAEDVEWAEDMLAAAEREADLAQRRVIDAERDLSRAREALASQQRRRATDAR